MPPNKLKDMDYDDPDESGDTSEEVEELTNMVGEYEGLFKDQESKIRELEARISQQTTQQQQAQQPPYEKVKEQWNEKFFENPAETTYALIQAAMQSYIPAAVAPIMQKVAPIVEGANRSAIEEVKRARKDFSDFEPVVNEILKTVPTEEYTPQMVDAAYLVAKGYNEFGDYKSVQIESGSSSPYEEFSEVQELTPAQKRVARKFGIKEQEYLDRMNRFEIRKRKKEEE